MVRYPMGTVRPYLGMDPQEKMFKSMLPSDYLTIIHMLTCVLCLHISQAN